ncbi:MAG: hypothetical protein HUJ31_06070, partial [Pseudomonadales bacterium]|nr:hypothetical protein [Pseudomonadales bacterium]
KNIANALRDMTKVDDTVLDHMTRHRILIPLTDLEALMKRTGKKYPASAATYLNETGILDVIPPAYVSTMVRPIILAWLQTDGKAAAAWVQTVDRAEIRDPILMTMGKHYQYSRNPDALRALAFYSQIENVPNRKGAIINVMPLLYLQDPGRFDAVAEDEELDNLMIADLKQTAVSLGTGRPPDR